MYVHNTLYILHSVHRLYSLVITGSVYSPTQTHYILHTMVSLQLSPDYGYVVLVVAATWALNVWQMLKVKRI